MELRKYRFENTEKIHHNGFAGVFDMPVVEGITEFDPKTDFIPFNFCKTTKGFDKGVHFFIDDYQFNRIWINPELYAGFLAQYKYMLSPDYSLFANTPVAIQMYKHYQKQWFGAFAEKYGAKVISSLCWSDKKSFSFCFDGVSRNTVVAVSSVGTQRYPETKTAFLDGFFEAMNRVEPTHIVFFGKVPSEIKMDNMTCYEHGMDLKFKNLK